jgi:hypothetical protein
VAKPASAQSIPTPSVPSFSLRFNQASYNVVDPYTGASEQVDNSTIDIIVKNQPFNTIYDSVDNITTSLYYNVQVKGHYTESWTEVYSQINYTYLGTTWATWYNYPVQSNSEYTIISLPANYSAGSQVDFRVQAVIANETEEYIPDFIIINPFTSGTYTPETVMFIVQTSDWSNPQTITIPTSSTSTSPTPTLSPTPTVPEFPSILIFIVPIFLVVVAVSLLLYVRKRKPLI